MDIILCLMIIGFIIIDIITSKQIEILEKRIDKINNKIEVTEEKVERLERMIFNIRVEEDKKVIEDAVGRIIRNIDLKSKS